MKTLGSQHDTTTILWKRVEFKNNPAVQHHVSPDNCTLNV